MQFLTILRFFTSNNRLLIGAYLFGNIALTGFFFFWNRNLHPDFNSLSLLRFLNINFFLFGTLLCQKILYQYYLQHSHYFFAQLPIPRLKMRIYEHLCWYFIVAIPYVCLIPILLFQVYYDHLWSTPQLLGFLGFQGILWLFFTNYALCLAMTGRLCWYLFWLIGIAANIYIRYSKNYQHELLGFFEVDRVLYQSHPFSLSFAVNYLGYALTLYAAANLLSLFIDKNRYSLLHRPETGLSRGLYMVFIILLLSVNFYLVQQLEVSKSKFSGLSVTSVGERQLDFWSSSVQLDKLQKTNYQTGITELNADILAFAEQYYLKLPAIHYQHHPELDSLETVHSKFNADSAIEVKFDFDQLNDSLQTIERDVLIVAMRVASRGWIDKSDQLIFLRGLAQYWSGRHEVNGLRQQRIEYLSAYPGFQQAIEAQQWQQIYQDAGPCLFDAMAATVIEKLTLSMPEQEWRQLIRQGLNLDHTWVPLHLIRVLFTSSAPAINTDLVQTLAQINSNHVPLLNYTIHSQPLYPDISQLHFQPDTEHFNGQRLQGHLYQHRQPGFVVDLFDLESHAVEEHELQNGFTSPILKKKDERFSGTFSWHDPRLSCRIFAPWESIQ